MSEPTPPPEESAPEQAATEGSAGLITDGGYALFVADFADEGAAWQAYEDLKSVAQSSRLDIEGVLVFKKDASGEVEVQKATDFSTGRGLRWGLVGGVVLGVLFPPSIIGSAAVLGAAGAGIGRLRHVHHRNELAEELAAAVDAGHSGLIALVSDPAAVEVQKALDKADRIVQKAVDKAVAEDIKAQAKAAESEQTS